MLIHELRRLSNRSSHT